MVFSSPPGGALDPAGAFKNSFPVGNIPGLNPVDNLTVFASPTGNDANNGLTPETAVQTLLRALTIVTNTGWNLSAVVSLAAGDYAAPGPVLNIIAARGGTQSGYLQIVGNTLTTLFDSLEVKTASGGSGIPWVLDCNTSVATAAGAQVLFTSGALAGKTFILGNPVGTTFSIMTTDTGPSPTDTLKILAPTARIVQSGPLELLTTQPVFLSNLDIVVAAALVPADVLSFGQSAFFLSGVRMYPATGALQAGVAILGANLLMGGAVPTFLPNPIGCAFMGASPTSILSIIILGGD